ncbi:MAG: hypothetical protein WC852_02095 [Candidatus Nanoarchaeia archaeon]|jgi:hypothetical protein
MKKQTKEKIMGLGLVGILASIPVAGICLSGAGCNSFKSEKGRVIDWNGKITETAVKAKGWEYVHWEDGVYGKNPQLCEQLSMPGKDTLLFPVYGVNDGNVVSGNMCCLGFKSGDGDFWAEYCMLLENKAEKAESQ